MRAKHIKELVEIVEKSNIDELEVTKWWGQKVRIRKNTGAGITQPADAIKLTSVAPPTPAIINEPEVVETKEKPAAPTEKINYIEIKAPMVGTFYRASAPDASPYVKEGDVVSKGQILCIIEAMKLMNELEADVNGRIVKILADNAQPVEYNQSLFLIDPS